MPIELHPDSDCARILRHRDQILQNLLAESRSNPPKHATIGERGLWTAKSQEAIAARQQLLKALETEEGLEGLFRYRTHSVLCHFHLIADEAYRIALARGEKPVTLIDRVTMRIIAGDKHGSLTPRDLPKQCNDIIGANSELPPFVKRERNLIVAKEVELRSGRADESVQWREGNSLVFHQQITEASLARAIGKPFDELVTLPMLNGLGLTVSQISAVSNGPRKIRIETDAHHLLEELAV